MQERKEFDPTSQYLMGLVNKYGLKKIPPGELEALGYTYDQNQNVVKIEELAKHKKEAEIEIEHKKEGAPFGRIEIGLDTGDFQLRHEINLGDNFDSKYRGINTIYDALPTSSPIRLFIDKLRNYTGNESVLTQDRNLLMHWIYEKSFDEFLTHEVNKTEYGIVDDLDIKSGLAVKLDALKEAGKKDAQKFYEDIQRARARYTDESALKSDFYNWYQSDKALEWSSDSDQSLSPTVLEYIKKHGIRDQENLSVHMLGVFLIEKSFNRLGQDIQSCKTFPEVEARLAKISGDDFPHSREKKRIETLISAAKTTEEKRKLSGIKKASDAKSREDNIFIDGLKQYFKQYEIAAKFFKKYLAQIEQASFRIIKDDSLKQNYFFDARVDPKLDKDPGAISGDCTEGKPLPFADPLIPVFNVKVFENESRHIGNIYLLVTTTKDGEAVWHLDAIQIPALLNWNTAVKQLLAGLGERAKLKGIRYITVNSEIGTISNYDYIEKAFMTYIENEGERTTLLQNPEVNEDLYSNFQYSGDAYIVWENK